MAIWQAGLAFLLLLVLSGWTNALRADDRHAGYYYPEPQTQETYEARARHAGEATRSLRIASSPVSPTSSQPGPIPDRGHVRQGCRGARS